MADATFIDLVGKEAIKDIETLKKQISLTVVEMKELVALSKKIKLPSQLNNLSGNAAKQIDKLNKQLAANQKLVSKLQKEIEKLKKSKQSSTTQTDKLTRAQQRLAEAQSREGREIERVRQQTNELNRVNRTNARIQLGLIGRYKQLLAQRNKARENLRNLQAAEVQNAQAIAKARKEYERLQRRVSAAEARTRSFTAAARNQTTVFGSLRSAAMSLSSALGLVGGAFLAVQALRSGIKIIKDFEKSNATLNAVLQKTSDETKELRDDAKRLGSTTVKTASQVTELQIAYARLGFSQQEIINLTEATIQGSIAMNAELDKTAELTGAVVNTFDEFSSTDAPEILDIMSLATAKSALNFQKLETGLPIVSGAANAAGIPFTKLIALMGKLSDAGIDVSSSSTALRNIFIESASQGLNYSQILDKIKNEQDKLTAANDEFGKRAAVSATVLAANIDKTNELDEALQKAAGTAKTMAGKELNTLDGALQLLKSAWEGVILRADEAGGINEKLTKLIRYLAENLQRLINALYSAVKVFVTYKATVLAIAAAKTIITVATTAYRIAVIALNGGLMRVIKTMRLLKIAMNSTGIGLFLSVVGGAYSYFSSFADGADKATEANEKFNKSLEETQKRTSDIQTHLSKITDAKERQARATELLFKAEDHLRETLQKSGVRIDNINEAVKILGKSYGKTSSEIESMIRGAGNFTEQQKRIIRNNVRDTNILLEEINKAQKEIDSQRNLSVKTLEKNKIKEVKLIKGTVKWYEAEISKLKEFRDSQALTNEEYVNQTEKINDLISKLKELQKIYNTIAQLRDINSGQTQDIAFNLETSGNLQDEIQAQNEALENSSKVLKKYKEDINLFLDTFSNDIIQNSGFQTTFDILNDNITGFGDNFAVTFNAIAESAQEVFSFISQASNNSFNQRIEQLNQQKEIAIAFAGESTAARERIETEYEERRKQIENERAKKQKDIALFNILVDTAQGIVSTIGNVGFPAAIPLISTIAAIGAAQAAFVSSQEIPQFKDGHLAGTHTGLALVNDGGRDEFLERDGRISRIKGRNVFLNMQKGDKIHKSESSMLENFNKELNGELMKNNIYAISSPQPQINVVNKGITKGEMQSVLRQELGRNTSTTVIDKKGWTEYNVKGMKKATSLNNKVIFKSSSV